MTFPWQNCDFSPVTVFPPTVETGAAVVLCLYRYYQHKTDFDAIPSERPIKLPCMVNGCPCRSYHYMPLNGTQPVRCTCKHFPDMHSVVEPYKCKQGEASCNVSVTSRADRSPTIALSHDIIICCVFLFPVTLSCCRPIWEAG